MKAQQRRTSELGRQFLLESLMFLFLISSISNALIAECGDFAQLEANPPDTSFCCKALNLGFLKRTAYVANQPKLLSDI
jgi:hypothetical protein